MPHSEVMIWLKFFLLYYSITDTGIADAFMNTHPTCTSVRFNNNPAPLSNVVLTVGAMTIRDYNTLTDLGRNNLRKAML